jgi:hypothetical protein
VSLDSTAFTLTPDGTLIPCAASVAAGHFTHGRGLWHEGIFEPLDGPAGVGLRAILH